MQDLKDLKRCFHGRAIAGTGPRPTGPDGGLLAMRRSGSGDPELQSLANRENPENPAHILLQVPELKKVLTIQRIYGIISCRNCQRSPKL